MLIVKLSSLGDILHALPLARGTKAAQPDCFLGWAVDVRFASLLEHNPYIDVVHRIPVRQWNRGFPTLGKVRQMRAVRRELRAQRYDIAIDAHGMIKSGFVLRLSGAPRRVAWARRPGRSRDWPLWLFANERVPVDSRGHAVETAYRLVEEVLGAPRELCRLYLPLADEERAWAREWYSQAGVSPHERLVGVCPGAAWNSKRWPAERYGAVAAELARRLGTRTVVCWGPGEEELRDRALCAAGEGALAIPRTTMREMAALMEPLRMFLAGDTGSLHIACALGVPVVGVFGPTDPQTQGPYGVPHRVVSPLGDDDRPRRFRHHDSSLIERVGVEDVLDAALDLAAEVGLS